MMVQFTVPGEAVPQGRPRASARNGKLRMYDPGKSKAYKQHVGLIARQYAPQNPIETPVSVLIKIYRQIPNSMPKKRRELANAGLYLPVTKPDCSNIAKGIEDAMNQIVYKDDSQIVELRVLKFYSDNPRAEVTVQTVEEVGA